MKKKCHLDNLRWLLIAILDTRVSMENVRVGETFGTQQISSRVKIITQVF